MMKRLTLICLLVLCLLPVSGWAESGTVEWFTGTGEVYNSLGEHFSYEIEEDHAVLTQYRVDSDKPQPARVITPDTLGGKPLTSIGVCAFTNFDQEYDGDQVECIVLPEGYWTGVKSNAKQWWIAEGLLGAITLLVLGLFLVKGRDPKTVKTVEFYPPENLSPAEIGYIYDNMVNDKDMTSLVMWFASKGYLKISAAPGEKKFLRKEQPIIILEKRRDLPADAPAYQKHFFDGLFEYGREANLKNLAVSTSFADSYEAAKESLQDRYGKTSPNRRLQEGQGYTAVGCLAGFIMLMVFGLATVFLYSYSGQFLKFLAVMVVCSIIVFLCVIHMSRPTPYRQKMLGRIQGFRDFIAAAELDRINQLVEQDPDYYYDILPYAYVFGLTDKWAKNFEALAPKAPDWYSGPDYYMMSPVVFCDSIGGSVRSSLSESAIHSTSASDFSGGGSGGGGFSGGGGGGGGGGGW